MLDPLLGPDRPGLVRDSGLVLMLKMKGSEKGEVAASRIEARALRHGGVVPHGSDFAGYGSSSVVVG